MAHGSREGTFAVADEYASAVRTLLVAALLPMTTCLAESLPSGFPVRRGPLTLAHAADLARADLPASEVDWLCRFELVITNGYDKPAPAVARKLRESGTKLFRYFWANGFTEGESAGTLPDGDWRKGVLRDHPQWLLNHQPLPGPPGTPPSYYFDLGDADLLHFLCGLLERLRAESDCAGTFSDYAGAYALPAEAAAAWAANHPDLLYDRALGQLFTRLHESAPGHLIFTNQACLGDPLLLPTVDYDLVESYGTSFLWGPVVKRGEEDFALSFLRPWDGPAGIKAMHGGLVEKLKVARPRGKLLCLDYMRPALVRQGDTWRETVDEQAVYYSYVAAALWGLESHCSGWYGREYRGPLYFADLGKPLGDGPTELAGAVVREYERGFVALLREPKAAEVAWQLRGTNCARLQDVSSGESVPLQGGGVTLRLSPTAEPVSNQLRPTGRVYLKLSN